MQKSFSLQYKNIAPRVLEQGGLRPDGKGFFVLVGLVEFLDDGGGHSVQGAPGQGYSPEYTLRAIAEASGINSMPTFHSLFKNKTGMTPSEFKKTQMDMKQ